MFFFAYLNRSIWNSFLVDSFPKAEIELLKKQFLQCRNLVQLYITRIVILLELNNSCEFMLVDCNDRSEYSGRALQ